MPNPWVDRVRENSQLSIFIDSGVTGDWVVVLDDAIKAFNTLFETKGLGVALTESQDAPATRGPGGADIAIATAKDHISSSYEGVTRSGAFDGNRMHGLTLQYRIGGKIEKAFVFLPRTPQVNTPDGLRGVGQKVMLVIAVHELVHACGLTNEDHSTDDLFQGWPQVDAGDSPAEDKVRIETGSGMSWMPPLVLSSSTIGHIKKIW